MTVYDVIDEKKRGEKLDKAQIDFFVRAVTDGSASDAQIAAFCMAVLWRGMDEEECFALTDAMANSGERCPRPASGGVFADKHSTGGVSDSTTLVLVPVLASLGVKCAKYSGRGLGHTGGTLDKLESFPSLRTDLTPEQFEKQVESVGAAIAGQTRNTVPADKRMYAVRDVTATVDSIPLIASSVMSKKLASFADIIFLDARRGGAPREAHGAHGREGGAAHLCRRHLHGPAAGRQYRLQRRGARGDRGVAGEKERSCLPFSLSLHENTRCGQGDRRGGGRCARRRRHRFGRRTGKTRAARIRAGRRRARHS